MYMCTLCWLFCGRVCRLHYLKCRIYKHKLFQFHIFIALVNNSYVWLRVLDIFVYDVHCRLCLPDKTKMDLTLFSEPAAALQDDGSSDDVTMRAVTSTERVTNAVGMINDFAERSSAPGLNVSIISDSCVEC